MQAVTIEKRDVDFAGTGRTTLLQGGHLVIFAAFLFLAVVP